MEFEPARPPAPFGIVPYPFSTFFELIAKQKQKNYFIRNDPAFYQKIRKKRELYFKNTTKFDARDTLKIFVLVIIWISILGGLFIFVFGIILDFNFLQGIVSIILIGAPSTYLFFAWIIKMRRNYFGEKYDYELKETIQELIDYGMGLIRENDLDPSDFPIKLRHNDYEGLVYENKGKNDFLGFFRN